MNGEENRQAFNLPAGQNASIEIAGGIKNALERGERLEKAKQSFISAGYKRAEVESAANMVARMSSVPTQQTSAVPVRRPMQPQAKPAQMAPMPRMQQLPQPYSQQLQIQPRVSKKSSGTAIWIVTVVICLIIVVAAGFLGVYWDKLANWFG